jgi:Flp pilus assembly protein TadG
MKRWLRWLEAEWLLIIDDGASTVEFAIVFPFFFLLMFAIFDFARACWIVNSLQFAVAQGARYVMTSPTGSGKPNVVDCADWTPGTYQSSVQSYVQRQVNGWNVSAATVSVPNPTANCGGSPPTVTVIIKASYTFTFVLTDLIGLFPGGIPMQQQATVTTPLGAFTN